VAAVSTPNLENFKVEHEMHTIKNFEEQNLSTDVLKFLKELNMDNENGE
jgi:hypothetical protein